MEAELRNKIFRKIKEVYDPEIPVDVLELGLIYGVEEINDEIHILMTLTSPNCPSAEEIPSEIKNKVEELDEVDKVEIELTFTPPYDFETMASDEARLELGFM